MPRGWDKIQIEFHGQEIERSGVGGGIKWGRISELMRWKERTVGEGAYLWDQINLHWCHSNVAGVLFSLSPDTPGKAYPVSGHPRPPFLKFLNCHTGFITLSATIKVSVQNHTKWLSPEVFENEKNTHPSKRSRSDKMNSQTPPGSAFH